jgi:hypothetical protein
LRPSNDLRSAGPIDLWKRLREVVAHMVGIEWFGAATASGDDLDPPILQMEKALGNALYRDILREYGRVNQPRLIRDAAVKQKVC